jgi:hypothetical protein
MTLGEHYSQLKTDLKMAELLEERWDIGDIINYIDREYTETAVAVLEKLLEARPDLWEVINSLE